MAQRERAQQRAAGHTHRKGTRQQKEQHRPTPGRHHPTPAGARLPRRAAEARTWRCTNRTGSCPRTTGPRTGERGHTQMGRRGYSKRGRRREHRRGSPPPSPHHRATTPAATRATTQTTAQAQEEEEDTAATARTRGKGPQRIPDARAQAPREGNPADTRLTHQPGRHTRAPAARIQRATPHLTAPPSHQPAT